MGTGGYSGSANNKDLKYFLLNTKLKHLNKNNIYKNIGKVINKLEEINLIKYRHKYLCLSCIFGAFLGDSIGSSCEFQPKSKNNHKLIFSGKDEVFEIGELTDDSEMAISAAFAYMDVLNEDPSNLQNLIYYYFCIWANSDPKDIGTATSLALKNWKGESIEETKFNYEFIKKSNWDSLANGFLMRISTFIVFYYYTHIEQIYVTIDKFFSSENTELTEEIINLYLDIYNESSINTVITHPNYENCISGAVFTLMTLTGMVTNDASKVYLLFKIITKSQIFNKCHKEKIENHLALNIQKKYEQIIKEVESNNITDVFKSMGYYIHAFKLSIYSIKRLADMGENYDSDIYYKIMCDICDFGGDTDTNCAIAGTMIGPLIGYKNFNKYCFAIFIRFIPKKRCQYNSAFMYIYVNYLEKKFIDENMKWENRKKGGDNVENKDLKEENKESSQGNNNEIENKDIKDEKNKIANFKYTAFNFINEFLNEDMKI